MTCLRDNHLTCSNDPLGSRQPPLQVPQGPGAHGSSPICPLPSGAPGLGLLEGVTRQPLCLWALGTCPARSAASASRPGQRLMWLGRKATCGGTGAKGQGSLEAPELRVAPCHVPGGQEARVGHREGQQGNAPLHHLVLAAGRSPPPPTATQMAKRQGDRWRWLAGLRVYFVRRHSQAKEHTCTLECEHTWGTTQRPMRFLARLGRVSF